MGILGVPMVRAHSGRQTSQFVHCGGARPAAGRAFAWALDTLDRRACATLSNTLTLCLRPGQAKNLLKAGYEVTVWNRTPERCAPLRDAGAAVAATAGEAAAASDLTFATLSTPDAARAVGAEVARSIRAGAGPGSSPLARCGLQQQECMQLWNSSSLAT
jgi:hypothetical protein